MAEYDGSGIASLAGHSPVAWAKHIKTKFKERDVAWSMFAARKGKLEQVHIAKIILRTGLSVPGPHWWKIFYEDNLHGLWEEHQLLYHSEALDLVEAYCAALAADAYAGLQQT